MIQQLLQLSEATGETGGQTDSQNAEETSNTPQKVPGNLCVLSVNHRDVAWDFMLTRYF